MSKHHTPLSVSFRPTHGQSHDFLLNKQSSVKTFSSETQWLIMFSIIHGDILQLNKLFLSKKG